MGDSPSLHPDTLRLVSFLIDETPLTADEHEHILQCAECSSRMAASAAEELERRRGHDPAKWTGVRLIQELASASRVSRICRSCRIFLTPINLRLLFHWSLTARVGHFSRGDLKMPTRTKASTKPSAHISRIRLASFGCGTTALSKRESNHFDCCRECRFALREVMNNRLLPTYDVPTYDVSKRAAWGPYKHVQRWESIGRATP